MTALCRDVETNVSVVLSPDVAVIQQCDLVLEETLPPSMYADLYQLRMLHDMGAPQVHL